jgi:predicted CoA-binding protein
MSDAPPNIAEFLAGKRIAVAGVSRDSRQTANAIYRKLRDAGYEVFPVNPHAELAEGVRCYPDLAAIPGDIDGVVAVTPPGAALGLVQQCADRGVRRIWFHRLVGAGSGTAEAVSAARERGMSCIVGACPFMYVPPIDGFHRCARWLLRWDRRATGQ